MTRFVAGQRIDALGVPAQGGVLARVPQWPVAIDAATTTRFIDAALAECSTVPEPIQQQANAIAALARHVAKPLENAA